MQDTQDQHNKHDKKYQLIANDGNILEVSHNHFIATEFGQTWLSNIEKFGNSQAEQTVPFSFKSIFNVLNNCIPTNFVDSDYFQCFYYFYPSMHKDLYVIISQVSYSNTDGFGWVENGTDFESCEQFDVSFEIWNSYFESTMTLSEVKSILFDFSNGNQSVVDWFLFVLCIESNEMITEENPNSFIERVTRNFVREWFYDLYQTPILSSLESKVFQDVDDNIVFEFVQRLLNLFSIEEDLKNIEDGVFCFSCIKIFYTMLSIEPKVIKFCNYTRGIISPEKIIDNLGKHFALFLRNIDIKQFSFKALRSFFRHPKIHNFSDEEKTLIFENFFLTDDNHLDVIQGSPLCSDFIKFLALKIANDPSSKNNRKLSVLLKKIAHQN